MESKVSPADIEARAEVLEKNEAAAAEAKPAADAAKPDAVKPDAAKPDAAKPDAAKPDAAKPDAVAKPDAAKPDAVKPDAAKPEPKQPNDPVELRKWATRVSQENAKTQDEIKALRASIEKLTKKPIDYKELAKNPDSIKAQIELERQEAVADLQQQLAEKTAEARVNETIIERTRREKDTENYPDWNRVYPKIQELAANTDGRVNFNKKPAEVLDDLYALALQLVPAAPAVVAAPPVDPAAPKQKTQAEIEADIAAAEQRGFEKAQAAIRAEKDGAGLGSQGKGGARQNGLTKEALAKMPKEDLKKLIGG